MADYLPMIREAEYEGFRRVVPKLPRSYPEWLNLHNAEFTALYKARGDAPTVVDISLAEFTAGSYDQSSLGLLLFAEEKGRPAP